ncbi:MAG: hypothetical protein HGA76_04820 [Candidatus Firestonebacteria bacterium]|nr:hypothetical protein [Candidatus Firestonebacteria bacterium]
MNLADIALLVLLLSFLILGWKIRSIRLLTLAAAVFLGVWAGNHFQARLLDGFQAHFSPRASAALAWVTPCLIASILVWLLGSAVTAVFSAVALSWLDRAVGAALAGTALLLAIAFGAARMQASMPAFLMSSLNQSTLAKPMLQMVQPLWHAGVTWWPALEKTLSR